MLINYLNFFVQTLEECPETKIIIFRIAFIWIKIFAPSASNSIIRPTSPVLFASKAIAQSVDWSSFFSTWWPKHLRWALLFYLVSVKRVSCLIVLIQSLDCAECLTCIYALCNNTDGTKQVKFQFLPAHFWDYFVSSGKPPSKFHIKRMIFCVLIKPPPPNSYQIVKKIYNCTSREQYYQIIKSNLPNTKV